MKIRVFSETSKKMFTVIPGVTVTIMRNSNLSRSACGACDVTDTQATTKRQYFFWTRLITTTWAELLDSATNALSRWRWSWRQGKSQLCLHYIRRRHTSQIVRSCVDVGIAPLDVPSSATIWIYINPNRDARYVRYHQSVDGRPVSQAVTGGGPFVPM